MKIRHLIFFNASNLLLCVSLFSIVIAGRAEDYVPSFYSRLNEASYKHDYQGMINLLCEVSHTNVWSFGAGLGPTDAESLQLTAVKTMAGLITDSKGEIKNQFVDSIATNEDQDFGEWQKYFRTSPSEVDQIINMLNGKNAAVRWLGIYKSSFAKRNNDLIAKLKTIAESDSFVQITRASIVQNVNQPPMLNNTENRLVCPLRLQAGKVLKQWGETVNENPKNVAKSGIQFLLFSYEQNPNERQDIIEAIELLSPDDSVVMMLKKLPANNTDDTLIIFKNTALRH